MYTSNIIVHIPVYIGSSSASLAVYVVSCNIPLLLSRISLKTAHATLVFQNDMLFIFNDAVPLITMIRVTTVYPFHGQLKSRNHQRLLKSCSLHLSMKKMMLQSVVKRSPNCTNDLHTHMLINSRTSSKLQAHPASMF